MAGPDYILDIQSLRKRGETGPHENSVNVPESGSAMRGRPWLAITWRCCNVYSRIYRNAKGTHYQGGCPKCGKKVEVPIGPDGTSSRFFEAR